MSTLASEYHTDFDSWVRHNVDLLKQGRMLEVDTENLIEELENMARRDRYELINRFIILIAHLLKWQFQLAELSERWAEFEGKSWRNSIMEQRVQIDTLLENNPSLRSWLPEGICKAYPKAAGLAAMETGKPVSHFPDDCPYTLEQLLAEDYYPNQ